MKEIKEKVLLIARVSDVEQRKALPAQELRLKAYAEQELKLTDFEYHEFDESAYKDARQKFSALVDRISKIKEPAIVVFDKIDRFTRDASQKEVRIMSTLVQEGRIELHFPSDNLFITKDSPATDLFRLGIGMLLAKYYSDSSRDNVKRRFAQMRNDGIWLHRAPTGYKNVNNGTDKNPIKDVEVNPNTSHYIIKAFELRSQGIPYAVIAKQLGKDGFRSSVKATQPPSKAFIEKIISNKFYYGVMVHDGKEYPHKYEPLISRSLFNQCQEVGKQRRHEKTKYDSKDYTFKKIAKCGVCGRAVSPFKARNSVYLRCASNGKCGNPNTAESLVIDKVAEDISNVSIPEHLFDRVVIELRKRHDDNHIYYTQNIEQTRKEYDAIEGKLHKIYYDQLDGRITQTFYDKIANELESTKQELNERLNLLTNGNKSFKVTTSYLLDLSRRAKELFETSDNNLRQKLLEYLLSNIELEDKKLSYTINDPFKVNVEANKKAPLGLDSNLWCGYRDSNPGPLPWQGSALNN